ncbi:hypothetical protein ACFL38_03580, partial [Candidatus Omnitrophota bacterium]
MDKKRTVGIVTLSLYVFIIGAYSLLWKYSSLYNIVPSLRVGDIHGAIALLATTIIVLLYCVAGIGIFMLR